MSEKTLRILLAENHPNEAIEAVRALLAGSDGGLQLAVVSTIATLLSSLKVADPEVILMDLSLYISEPYDAVRMVHRAAPGVPLIVFADPADKQRAAQSLTEGAIDYLLKGFMDPRTVERALRTALERNTMEGLADLKILNACCRRTDVVARLGEEQFAMLLVDAIAATVSVLRQRVEQHLAMHNKTSSPWAPIEIRLSAGMWAAQDGRSFAEFLDAVETELRRGPANAEELVRAGSGTTERA